MCDTQQEHSNTCLKHVGVKDGTEIISWGQSHVEIGNEIGCHRSEVPSAPVRGNDRRPPAGAMAWVSSRLDVFD